MSSLSQRRRSGSSNEVWKKLDDYQQDAVTFAVKVKTAALLFEQGTGKTWIAGGVLEHLMSLGGELSALLVVPLTNIESTWGKFLRAQLPQLNVARTLEEFEDLPFPRALLLHYEGVPRIAKKLTKMRWTFCAHDEAQRLKNRQSIASKIADRLHDSCGFKVILTGTPMDKSPQEMWAQYRFLNNRIFGRRYKDFEDEFMEPLSIDMSKCRYGTVKWQHMMRASMIEKRRRKFNFDKLEEFNERIAPYTLRVTKSVLGLKPVRYIDFPVTMRGEQRRIYDEVEQDLVSTAVNVTAPMKGTKIGKLQQISGGYVISDEGQVYEVGRTKMRALKRIILRHARDKIVVFCRYTEEVRAIAEELGRGTVTLTGKTKKRDRATIQDDFQAGHIPVLVCQIKTGGVGIDLFRSCVGVMYSTTYSWVDFDQAICRLHRRGQTEEVQVYLISSRGSIDTIIYDALRSKSRVTQRVLKHLQEKHRWQRPQRRPLPRQPSRPPRSSSTSSARWPRTSTSRTPRSA